MLLQPYVENAIWHGLLLLRARDPFLQLRFFTEGNELVCVVEDNGIGRKKSAEQKAGRAHESAGMKNTEERIAILNKVNRSLIGTTTNANGTKQATYAGKPLYYYSGDTTAGDTKGQGVTASGATGHLVNPEGNAVGANK